MVHMAGRMRTGTGMGWLERWWEAWVHENRHLEGWACCKSLCRSMNYPAGHCESQLIQIFGYIYIEEYLRTCCWKYNLLNSNSKTSIYSFPSAGGRPCDCSTDSHRSSWESGGDDQTLYADRCQHPAQEGHFRGHWLLWFPDPLHSWNLGRHPHCLPWHSCLHLCSYKVSDATS